MPVQVYLSAPGGHSVPTKLLERAVRAVLESEAVVEAEISVTFLGDEPIQAMNDRWLTHDWVPDVLSFGLHESGATPVGDVYVGVEQADRQAREHGVSVDEELVRLTVHGTLHVLGYDHAEDEEGVLHLKQERLVQSLMGAHTPGAAGERTGSGRGNPRAGAKGG